MQQKLQRDFTRYVERQIAEEQAQKAQKVFTENSSPPAHTVSAQFSEREEINIIKAQHVLTQRMVDRIEMLECMAGDGIDSFPSQVEDLPEHG